MQIRLALPEDLDEILRVYASAREFMRTHGNPTQWGSYYPSRALVLSDIESGACRVITRGGTVHAVFALFFGEEPTYRVIEHGAWPDNAPYAAIHRVASDGVLRGVFRAAADYAAGFSDRIRIDTHENNLVMQRCIESCGFVRCGIIHVANGSPRLAYQWNKPAARSGVGLHGGVPALFINGKPFPAAAYLTYLQEYNDYASFAAAGYRLFSVPVLCAGRWINAAAQGVPFHKGAFDSPGAPDFSALDSAVQRILSVCPQAYILPRVNLAAPLRWIAENPGETDGSGRRESLYSAKYRAAAEEMLRAVIRHVAGSAYVSRIAGYQLAGGNTEEWFHFDLSGGACENAVPAFNAFLQKNYPGCGFSGLPDFSLLRGPGPYHNDPHLAAFGEFANVSVSRLICALAAAAKEETGGSLAVGAFYGYSLEVSSPLWGTHALQTLLENENIDFICSPNSYVGTRDLAVDWPEMYPAASVRLHGKLCLQECDIRTHLTRPLCECAPEYDPERRYTAPIWQGLQSREQAVNALRKAFCRQLTAGNGFWLFDMWGGWYRDPVLLKELCAMRAAYEEAFRLPHRESAAELAVFIDETAFRYYTEHPLRGAAFAQRAPLGDCGAPYDMFLLSDFAAVYKNYKAVLFLGSAPTPGFLAARERCERGGVPYLALTEEKPLYPAAELRAFCREAGMHIYCETNDIVYVNRNYLALCAVTPGEKQVTLPRALPFKELLCENGVSGFGTALRFVMRQNEVKLFRLGGEA